MHFVLNYQKTIGFYCKIIITLIFVILLAKTSNVNCATIEEIQSAQNIDQVIRDLNEQDLLRFGENLGINRQHFFEQVLEENIFVENVSNQRIRWEALIIFLLGTFALFMIARYGRDILDFLFDLGTNVMPEVAQQSVRGLLQFAINTGHGDATRTYLVNQAQHLLNNPETAPRVVNAFRTINRHI